MDTEYVKNLATDINNAIKIEVDKTSERWQSKLITEQKEREKMRQGWQAEKEKNQQLQAENKRMRKAIEAALRISDLWTLKEVETMFEDEAKALLLMKEGFEQALKEGE